MKMFEIKSNIPLDVIRYIDSFVYIKLNNDTIRHAVKLYFENKEQCLKIYGPMEYWNTSKVTNMSCLFSFSPVYCQKINPQTRLRIKNTIDNLKNFNKDISRWNVSNVTNMSWMFCYLQYFNCDISTWNVSNVKENLEIFNKCNIKEEYKPHFI